MAERGVLVDHATVHRWSLKILPALATVSRRSKHPVGKSWRMDETYIKVRSRWRYLYRVVDRDGDTVDFLLTGRRDEAAARRFLERAIDRHGEPEKMTIDKSGANTAAIDSYNVDHKAGIEMRRCKYLNNIVEQDHRAIKRITRPMLGFKSLRCARILLAGIETMHMIRKEQLGHPQGGVASAAEQSTPWPSELQPTKRLASTSSSYRDRTEFCVSIRITSRAKCLADHAPCRARRALARRSPARSPKNLAKTRIDLLRQRERL
jgi:transposase-like protein